MIFKGSPHLQNKFWKASLKPIEFKHDVEADRFESNLDSIDLPDLIIPGLYLGSQYSAKNLSALTQRSITHILVVGKDIPQYYPEVIRFNENFFF